MTLDQFRRVTENLPDDLPMVSSCGDRHSSCCVVIGQKLRDQGTGMYGTTRRDKNLGPLVPVLIVI